MRKDHTPCCRHYVSVNAADHVGICKKDLGMIHGSQLTCCDQYEPDRKMQGGAKNGSKANT